MTNYKIVADPLVKEDLIEARDFLNSRRKGIGKKFISEYESILKNLQINPHYRLRYKNVRCLPMKKFKYMIHFKLDDLNKLMHIYSVLSTYQNPTKNWL